QFQNVPYNLTPVAEIQDWLLKRLEELCPHGQSSDRLVEEFWKMSTTLEPKEKDSERVLRLLKESGFFTLTPHTTSMAGKSENTASKGKKSATKSEKPAAKSEQSAVKAERVTAKDEKKKAPKSAAVEAGDFPRGGSNGLTPLEFREVARQAERDVLFSDGVTGGSAGKKKRR
ncbi:cell division cycle- protein, partial [Coemansia sp. S17]